MAAKTFNFLKPKVGKQSVDEKSTTTYIDIAMPYSVIEEDLSTLKDESAITNAVATLLCTRKLGRPLVPEYGLDLREYLGQPMDSDVAYFIKDDITKTVEAWEPRIKIREVDVEENPDDEEIAILILAWFPTLNSTYKKIGLAVNQNGIKVRSID